MEDEQNQQEGADFFKTLNSLGISPVAIAQFLQELPKVVNGVARGSIQFALEEKAIQDSLQRIAQALMRWIKKH